MISQKPTPSPSMDGIDGIFSLLLHRTQVSYYRQELQWFPVINDENQGFKFSHHGLITYFATSLTLIP